MFLGFPLCVTTDKQTEDNSQQEPEREGWTVLRDYLTDTHAHM